MFSLKKMIGLSLISPLLLSSLPAKAVSIVFADGDAATGYIVNTDVNTFSTFSIPTDGANAGYPLTVLNEQITISSRDGTAASTYDLSGNLLNTYSYPGNTNFDQILDGTTNGVNNFAIRCCSENNVVTMSNLLWQDQQVLFSIPFDGAGITYDSQTDSLWLADFSSNVINYALTGTELSRFQIAGLTGRGLSYDANTNSLWFINNSTVYNYSTSGALIASYNIAGFPNNNIFGGEIAFINFVTGPSAGDTLASMQGNASSMRGLFSLQASYVNPGLSYDCNLFNDKGLCFSMTARNTSVSGSGIDSSSGVATAAYRVNPNIRIGGFIEQMTSGIRDGGIRLDNNSPDYGVFGVWQENENGEGLKLRAAYRYGNKDLDVTRQAVGTAESGFGKTELSTQGVQFTGSYGFQVHEKVLLSPYAGLRYIKIKRDGYTEELSAAVTTPLTYDNLTQETTSALLGANVAVQLTPQVTASGAMGIEHDTARKIGNYSATGVDNLESINFNDDSRRTRAVASLGLGYRIGQTQHIGAQVVYREETFGDKSTTTGMLTYTAGF